MSKQKPSPKPLVVGSGGIPAVDIDDSPMPWYFYISKSGVAALKNYKYSAAGSSPLTDLMTPFWNWSALMLPGWLAPNVITMGATISVIVSFLLCASVCHKLECGQASWVHVVSAVCIFIYQLLDNLDGKQARNTGNSSPLGELFDHGLDAVVMGLSVIPLGCAVPANQWLVVLFVLSSMSSFYACHWEAYHTSVTNFSLVTAVVEAQFITMAAELIAGCVGTWVWAIPIYSWITLSHVFWWGGAFFPFLGTLQSMFTVIRATGFHCFHAFFALLPMYFFLGVTLFWLAKIPILLLEYPYTTYAVVSLVFAYIMQRLLVQHLAKEPMRLFYPLLSVYGLTVVYQIKYGFSETLTLAFLALCIVQELFFGWSIIWQMTGFLQIKAFCINPRAKAAASASSH